jgi:hypothetical protein
LEVLADLFKRHKRPDEFDDADGVKNAVDCFLRDARHIIAWFTRASASVPLIIGPNILFIGHISPIRIV